MKQYGSLLEKIGTDLSIQKGLSEKTDCYARRLIYSATGRIMLASLYDRIEREPNAPNMVSVIHFKQKGKEVLRSYAKMYPHYFTIENTDKLIEYIYDVFASSGYFYHTANYIAPVISCQSISQGISLFRGSSLHISVCMSGLGLWKSSKQEETSYSIPNMFCLSEQSLESIWNQLIEHAKWEKSNQTDGFQFQNTRNFRNGYWLERPEKETQISIARFGSPGARTYYLYRIDHNSLYLSQVPSWMIDETGVPIQYPSNHSVLQLGQYQIMNACLNAHGTLPPIRVSRDGLIVHLQFGYILPPTENALVHLYSWPEHFASIPNHFNRIMSAEVFHALKPIYETIGFQFKEESL